MQRTVLSNSFLSAEIAFNLAVKAGYLNILKFQIKHSVSFLVVKPSSQAH